MTRAAIMAAALGAFLGGCTDVPDLEPGECGNRVVEEGEDCDTVASEGLTCGARQSSNQCFFECDPDAASPACPPEWECGRDRRCREPTGAFDGSSVTMFSFATQEFTVGDVNGDGYNDLVGNQSSRVTVRFGAGNATLSDDYDTLVPEPVGPLLFDYVDEDRPMDVIVPIADGLFTLVGDPQRSLEPVAYASLALNPGGDFRTVSIQAFTGDPDLEILGLFSDGMVFFEAASSSAVGYPGQGNSVDILGRDIAVGNIDGDVKTEIALAFDQKNVVHICQGTDAGTETSLQIDCNTTVTMANPIQAAGGTRFADVDGDGFLDLLVSVTVGGKQQVEVALNDGLGTLVPSGVAELFSTSADGSERANVWPIAVADLEGNGDRAADYVFSKEIVLVTESGVALPQSGQTVSRALTDTWTSATITDINGDERNDVVVSLDRLDGIDFFVNNDDPTFGVVFNKFRIDTDGPPRLLRAGDFDGDLIGDVAFVQGEYEDAQPNEILVSFGNTSGAPSTPTSMGSFGKIDVLEPLQTSIGVNAFDTITDLAVIFSTTEPMTRSANVLRGDSSRRMLSPFFLFDEVGAFERPHAVVLGSFGTPSNGSPTALDLLVITEVASNIRAWLLGGTGTRGGLSSFPDIFPADGEGSLLPGGGFDVGCALWRAGDLDGNPGDEIVAIDGWTGCDNAGENGDPATLFYMPVAVGAFDGTNSAALAPDIRELGLELVNLRALHLRDMDLDDRLDLVAVFRGDAAQGIGSKAVILWNDDAPEGLFDLSRSTVIESPPFVFYDAAPMQIGSAAPDLVLLTEGLIAEDGQDTPMLVRWILRATYEPGSRSYAAPTVLLRQGSTGHLAIADLDGDGLDDIVYTDDDNAHVVLQTPGQPLGSRNPASSAGGAAP
jgi:hypothetical protein